jgi:two-component system, chemotaxis family, CheB/CheR fusion protein
VNEELKTSKEELQSVNEELHTVNLRLTEKVDALDSTNTDLRTLFSTVPRLL